MQIWDVADYGFYKYVRVTVDGIRGSLYYVDKKLTNEDKKHILSFRNTKLFF